MQGNVKIQLNKNLLANIFTFIQVIPRLNIIKKSKVFQILFRVNLLTYELFSFMKMYDDTKMFFHHFSDMVINLFNRYKSRYSANEIINSLILYTEHFRHS